MKYQVASRRDFDAVRTLDETIYHQRGGYELLEGDDVLIPANRSYRPIDDQSRGTNMIRDNYTNHDRVINDSVDDYTALRQNERIVRIYGKQLLFLVSHQVNMLEEFSTNIERNPHMSMEATLLLKEVVASLSDVGGDIDIGIYGSHQMGLNRYDSDLDVIAWARKENRKEEVDAICEFLRGEGYTPISEFDDAMKKYAKRYAKRTGLSEDVGALLASQRMRWISPEGVSTSLQCMHSDYDHEWAATVVNAGADGDYEILPESLYSGVEVAGGSESYNFPRLWNVFVDGKEADAFSFDWAHQNMGTDANEKYTMRARKIINKLGKTVYFLSGPSDYLLPTSIVS